jgi:ribosomal protein RSM22 (predicted rRNA methylase)
VLTRGSPRLLAKGRVIRRPIKAKGHVHLDLCSAGGIQRVTVSRRHGSLFKQARAVDWGDAWTDES